MLEFLPKPLPADRDLQAKLFQTPSEELEEGDWRLHGEIAKFFGRAKAYAINILSATGVTKSTYDVVNDNSKRQVAPSCGFAMYINGEIDVHVYGVEEPCKGFFWTENESSVSVNGETRRSWRQRGYVCYADDKKACDFARRKMQEELIRKR